MCLAIPARVIVIKASDMAVVEIGGVRREVSLALVDADIGDYVLLHAGIAITTMDQSEAEKTLALINGDESGGDRSDGNRSGGNRSSGDQP